MAFLFFLTACAGPARELPPDLSSLPSSQRLLPDDLTSPEYGLACDALVHQIVIVRQRAGELDSRLRHIQADNQAKAAAGLALLMADDTPSKNELSSLEARKERLLRIAQARECKGY